MGKPSAPPAPDYAAAARSQGVENIAAARTQAKLNTPNTYTPYGNQTVSWGAGAPVVDQAGYNTALNSYNNWTGARDRSGNPVGRGAAPDIANYTTPGESDTPTIYQTLNPESQAALEAQQRIGRRLSQTAENYAVPTLEGALRTPFNSSGYDIQTSLGPQMPMNYGPAMGMYGMAGSVGPGTYGQAGSVGAGQYGQAQGVDAGSYGQAQGGVAGPNLQTGYGDYGDVQNAPSGGQYGQAGGVGAGQYGMAQGPNISGYGQAGGINAGQYGQAGGVNAGQFGNLRTGADMSGVAAMPVSAGMTGQQAIMARLQPQLAQQSAATAQQLANQGITPGSEAYNNAMREQQQGQNDLLSQAALQGIGLDMSANQQGYGQAMGQAGLYNAALGQGFGQSAQAQQLGNQAIGQNYGQGLSAQQLGNQAIGQNVGFGLQANAAQNAAVGQNFGQGFQAQQLGNQAIGQNFGQGMQANAAQNAAQAQRYGQAANNAQFNNAAQLSQFQANLANQEARNAALAQNFGQGMQGNAATNAAIAQNYGQGVSSQELQNRAIGQNYGQGMSSQDQANAAMGQNYGQAGTSAGLYNQAAAQQYNQNLGAAQFRNQAQQQRLQQNIAMRNQPLNEIMGLLSGSQIQTPQFQNYVGGGNIEAAPVAQAATNQGNYNTAAYNAKMQALNGLYSGIGTIAGGALGGPIGAGIGASVFKSDIRLKSNIIKVGNHPKGFGIYEYDIDGHRERGVMAHEVEKIIPEAVMEHPDGYKMVNYGAL